MTVPETRGSRPPKEPATSTTTTLFPDSNAPGAAEVELLRGILDADRGIWQDLMNGTFKLALRCEVCGRWLTAHSSKSAGIGPRCAARAVK
jgi:hypothetical protein